MMQTIHAINTIVSDPRIRRGQPIIAGTRVRVSDIVASHIYRGLVAEELALNFNLDLGQVFAALAYYYQNKAEMDAAFQAEQDEAERLLAELDQQGKVLRLE